MKALSKLMIIFAKKCKLLIFISPISFNCYFITVPLLLFAFRALAKILEFRAEVNRAKAPSSTPSRQFLRSQHYPLKEVTNSRPSLNRNRIRSKFWNLRSPEARSLKLKRRIKTEEKTDTLSTPCAMMKMVSRNSLRFEIQIQNSRNPENLVSCIPTVI